MSENLAELEAIDEEKGTRVILDVPYYSEFGEIDGTFDHIKVFKRRSCGIVSAKMIADYWAEKKIIKKITLTKLIALALNHRAYSSNSKTKNITGEGKPETGWIHAGLVRTFQEIGLSAWRRMWFLRTFDKAFFRKEGLVSESVTEYYSQVLDESLTSFRKNIDFGNPFMVGILKSMGTKKSPHFVVITGYKLDAKGRVDGLFINDPHNPKNGKKDRPKHKNQFISLKDFDRIWRKRAIFIAPK